MGFKKVDPNNQSFQDFGDRCVVLALSTTSAAIASALAVGKYVVKADVDCYVEHGATGLTAIVPTGTASSAFLTAKVDYYMEVTDSTNYGFLAGIVSTGTGNLFIRKVREQ